MIITVLLLGFGGAAWLEWKELRQKKEGRRTYWIVFGILGFALIYNAAVSFDKTLPSLSSYMIPWLKPIQDWILMK